MVKEIIITDDEPELRKHMLEVLGKNKNYRLRPAASAARALEILSERKINLLITDWQMPVISGVELLREVRKRFSPQELPVILVSGIMISSHNLADSLEAEANDFLRKPIDETELKARVRNLLRMAELYEELSAKQTETEALRKKEKQLAEERLEELGKDLHQKHLIISNFKSKIGELADFFEESDKKKAPAEQQASTNAEENEWIDFRLRLEKLHPDFFPKVQALRLTPNEERLAAYIRVGLNAKETASLMQMTPATARKARQRLRDKLGASDDQALKVMLQEM